MALLHEVVYQDSRIAVALVSRVGADRADLAIPWHMKALARHSCEPTLLPDGEILAQLYRPRQERSGMGDVLELEHRGHVGGRKGCEG